MVSERIDDSPQAPAILVTDGPNHGGPCCDGPIESGIRVFHGHHHPHRTAAERLGAEVQVRGRLVCEPEFGCPYGEPSDHRSTFAVDAEQFAGSECRLVELDRPRPTSNREHWCYRGLWVPG